MTTKRIAHFAASVAVFAPVCVAVAETDPPANPPEQLGHKEVPGDAYRPAPRGPRLTSPAGIARLGDYTSVQVNVDENGDNIIGDAANEPSIAVDPRNSLRMAIGWRQFDTISSNFRQGGWGYTTDGGRTWTFPGVIQPGEFASDPVLDFNNDGGFYFYSLQPDRGPGEWACYLYKSFDVGQSWPQDDYGWGGDKEWITVDRSGGIGDGNFYAWWSSYFTCCDGQFTRSTDGGQTFMDPIWIPNEPMWGTATVGPDGEVYIGGYDFWSWSFVMARSSNAQDPAVTPVFELDRVVDFGGSWSDHTGPNPGGLMAQVWVSCDHSDGPTRGNVYMMCSVDPGGSDPMDVMFVASTDGGATWSSPKRVNDDTGNAWQWFSAMEVAPSGRIDVIWNDTRDDPGGYDSQLYYACSTDAGATFSTNEPISPAFDPHVGWPSQDKIGDYSDLVSDKVGVDVTYSATFTGGQDVYYVRIGDYDCNDNGIGDATDIADGSSSDWNANGIPDECECLSDVTGDGTTDVLDLLAILAAWGTTGADIPEDVNFDGTVDVLDLLAALSAWGPCA